MWYEKKYMKALFYAGAACLIAGFGLWMLDYIIPGAVIMAVSAASMMLGFFILRANLMIETNMRRKQDRIKRNRKR